MPPFSHKEAAAALIEALPGEGFDANDAQLHRSRAERKLLRSELESTARLPHTTRAAFLVHFPALARHLPPGYSTRNELNMRELAAHLRRTHAVSPAWKKYAPTNTR